MGIHQMQVPLVLPQRELILSMPLKVGQGEEWMSAAQQ